MMSVVTGHNFTTLVFMDFSHKFPLSEKEIVLHEQIPWL